MSFKPITSSVYVPIDIGKNVHWIAAYAGYDLQPVIAPQKLRTHQPGFAHACQLLDELLAADYDGVTLGHEPTGIYHEAWARAFLDRYEMALTAQHLAYRFLNPLQVKRQRQALAGTRRHKSDRRDLVAMAHCLRDGLGYPATLPTGAGLRFSLWVRACRRAERERRRLTVALLSQLDRLWPGLVVNVNRFTEMHPSLPPPVPLVQSKPLTRKHVQALLHHCPNPYHLRAKTDAQIQAFFRRHVGRCGPATREKVSRIIRNAVLPPPEVAALLADHLHHDWQRYCQLDRRVQTLDEQIETLVPHTAAAVLTSVPGISAGLAGRFLGYLGHPQRFETAAAVWSFAGFDPVTTASGDYRRVGEISRKGHPGLRDTLYLIALHTARRLPALRRTKERALRRGKDKVGALIHTAHRANRICFRLLYDQVPFDPSLVT